ncbi:MAG: hypothetical protein R3258_07065 [Acidimicrobiia bacterium]|nr:hypothetical protein [Acidimicrobiia bacterium]
MVVNNHKIVRYEPPEIEVSDATKYPDRDLADEEFVAELNKAAAPS